MRQDDVGNYAKVIPLRDENPTRTFSFITILIIVINVLVFIYEFALGKQLEDKINQFAVIPYNIMHMSSPKVLLTLISSLFFHAGIVHLFGNMLYLWVFGNNVEDRLGHLRFLFFYLMCGIIATLGHILAASNSKLPVIGASGAISGILGAYLLLYPRAKVLVLIPLFYIWRIERLPAMWFLIFWIILQIFYGTISFAMVSESSKGGVAWLAHISGFFCGLLLLKLFIKRKRSFII